MADNYLEKRMEDYRKGNLKTQYHKKTTPTGKTAGVISFPIGVKRILVAVSSPELREAIVAKLTSAGCRTSFCGDFAKRDTLFAQKSGSMFCPVADFSDDSIREATETVSARWEGIDIIITDRGDCIGIATSLTDASPSKIISSAGENPSRVADFVLFACAYAPKEIRI